jgi:diguanylate cyclase (GGDEF)-like protein
LGLVFRRRIPYRVLQPLLGFGVLPGLAAAAQSLVYGIAVIWPAIALSLLVIYLWVEGEMLALDYLTGLQNRRNLHRFLEHRLKEAKAGRGVGGLMIDVDDFKKINDTWGHQAGDEALRTLAQCLRSCFHHQDFIARYAGDEFVAILNVENAAELEAAVHRFRSLLRENRRVRATPWELGVSVGAGMFDPAQAGAADPVDRFLAQLDRAMYQDKAGKGGRD